MDYNLFIDIICAIIVGVIIAFERMQRKAETLDMKLLHLLLVCVLAIFITDIPGLLLNGSDFEGARPLLWIFNTLYWIPNALFGWLWLMFVDYRFFNSKEHLRKRRYFYAFPMILEIALILINPITGWIFTINEANQYTTGSLFVLNYIPYLCYILASLILPIYMLIKHHSADEKRRWLQFLIFMILPIYGVVLEIVAYGISWVWPFVALALLMVYISVQQQYMLEESVLAAREKEKAAKLEQQLINTRIKIMLSQIQPHFLYNSLAVIQALCETEPDTAGAAMKSFSDFLRGNMDSLTMDKPISIEQEIKHTNNYLALEKLRYGDTINVEYDIKATGFRLPTLTLQPIVENAVRYGIAKREEGGTVKISTQENENSYIITVTDDGEGFDAEQKKDDGRTHIGITNVCNRLREMSGGTLEIISAVGNGTTAVITLPKAGEANE